MDAFERVTRYAEEVITPEELRDMLEKPTRKAYIGFEPSGLVHTGWIICAHKIRDLKEAGFEVTVLLADWHAWVNDKMGGSMEAIGDCGEYMKDCFAALGVEGATYLYASDYVNDARYWELVLKVAKHASLARIRRSMDIMGREAAEAEQDFSKFLYPAMQVADIFYLDLDLAYGGMDQRHAHMLCRDIAKKMGAKSPVALHTPILSSLEAAAGRMDAAKMSKSSPSSCVFIHDSEEQVAQKLRQAYCPEGQVEGNPVLEMCRYIVFPATEVFTIARPAKYGGDLSFERYEDLETAFAHRQVHPLDLKNAVAVHLNRLLQPVRDYFDRHPENLDRVRAHLGM
ncbi:MAG: tyrosine--tRNA ligase [Candidatus Thermoplasmatota archaeon]|nr:tyrosine--tRNA ligase [Candidatus Thermoplasmatota archaeon]